jgi:hypothetical protein
MPFQQAPHTDCGSTTGSRQRRQRGGSSTSRRRRPAARTDPRMARPSIALYSLIADRRCLPGQRGPASAAKSS